jgi:DNA-binding protein Fis
LNSSNKITTADDLFSSKYIDIESITDSIYDQLRPKVKITRLELSKSEIDNKTRAYIQSTYVPALVKNYIQLYESIKASGNTITTCNDKLFSPMSKGSNLHISLCVSKIELNKSYVKYFSKLTNQPEKETVEFVFKNTREPILISVMMHTSPNQVSISGI